MNFTDTIIIGGGQAGLAASFHPTAHGHDHVVLERGRVGQRWRAGVWDALRMLSPNWINTLPGWGYHGADRERYASAAEFAANLAGYAASFDAPVIEGAGLQDLRLVRERFEVTTAVGSWCDHPPSPPFATMAVPNQVETLDLRRAGIRTVVWATGHRRAYPWLGTPVLDGRREIRQRHGLTPIPGMYVLGHRFQHYRSSNWVCGGGRDAAQVTDHPLSRRLRRSPHV
jgi:2-polyprenyl-6-methoxyphenol hydroxylase-like FAD-dependent oxidoreductase